MRSYLFVLSLLYISPAIAQHIQNTAHSTGTNTLKPSVICEYLAYEPFDYPINTPLNGLNKGENFEGSWNVQNGNIEIPGYQIGSTTGSLSFSNLTSGGHHISGGNEYLTSGRRLNTSLSGPFQSYVEDWDQNIGAKTEGQSLWVSMLMAKKVNNNEELYVEFHDNNIAWCNSCSAGVKLGLGYFGSPSNVGGQKKWSLKYNNTIYTTNYNVVIDEAALLVVHLTFNNGSTEVEMYVNPPDIGQINPGKNPDLVISNGSPLKFKSLTFYAGDIANRGALDEIRMATTFQCAVPDASIEYLIPPVAIIMANPTSGIVPVTIDFDGSQSINNSSGDLTYLWDFGDDSALSNDVTPQHTYTISGGIATASLTVTDINGKSHTAYQTITLLDENGTINCMPSITSIRKADCTGNNAHIRINSEYNTDISLTLGGTTIPPTYDNDYTNLTTGIYELTIEGNNGCYNHYNLHIDIDSTLCQDWIQQSCSMEIGTNLPGFADWEPHRAMRNFLKNTRGQAIPYSDACNCWSFDEETNQSIFSQITFDDGGYPLQIPYSTNQGNIKLRYFVSASGANMPPGHTYVLLYDGDGTIDISGAFSNVQQQPGRIQFDLMGDGTFWFQITQSTLGNHIKNIRVVRLEDELADLENEPFYSVFLEKIAPFSVLRFMDWQHTNNNPMTSWNQRTKLTRFSYGSEEGVPYELIIQLANMTKKDIWICVPHAADADFITQMAELFKSQLDPSINIYLEYSNEVWNWIFSQAQYNIQHNPFNLNYGRAMALKAKKVFEIWHQVFEDEQCRVKRVLGIQAGFNWLNEQILAHLDQDDWDYGSPTHYFGLDHEETGNPRLDLLGTNATVNDIMTNAQNNFNSFKTLVKQDYRNIQIFGKPVITYEGGQHFVGNVFGQPYDYQQAMWDAQSSPQMYDMYVMLHDSIRSWGCKLATNFSLAGAQESVYGSWGVMETIDIQPPYFNTAPKFQALLDSSPSETCLNTNIWLGKNSHLWSDRCNWSKGKLPDENTNVIINPDYQFAPQVDINVTIRSISVQNNANLTILSGITFNVVER